MSFNDFLKLSGALISSIGGASALIFGLSNFLGKVWVNKIFEKDKMKYRTQLEKITNNYQKELEKYKLQLEKSKEAYFRYSNTQFSLYQKLWSSLCNLEWHAENLWNDPTSNNSKEFSKQLEKTSKNVKKHMLLLEKEHYKDLLDLLKIFKKYDKSKGGLISIIQEDNMTSNEIAEITSHNKDLKTKYKELLNEIGDNFRSQLRNY